jgi:hydroxyethylthiazole kinase-like uncharacterized protein yjeF
MQRRAEDLSFDGLTALATGPGLGRSAASRATLTRALASALPLVLDADALNQIAADPDLSSRCSGREAATLLTPHPAEAARLLGTDTRQVQADRIAAAREIARRFRCGVVLKGAGSICAFADGQWSINASGNPGLSSAGTGDVLTGFVAGLAAQGLAPELALGMGVCLHGAAADRLVAEGEGPIGLTASELCRSARALLNGAR